MNSSNKFKVFSFVRFLPLFSIFFQHSPMCELGESYKKASQKICNDSFFNDIDSLVATFLEFPSSQFFNGAQ